MNTKERDAFIRESLNQGMSLSDVQKALAEQFDIRMTYLELRMVAAELEVDWKKQDKPAPAKKEEVVEESDTELPEEDWDEEDDDSGDDSSSAAGKTKVTISKLIRPGAALSGDVEFSSGAKGEWFVDSMGRLGFNPAEGSGQPNQNDLREFQKELQKALGY
ncbi:MAG: hypothetical protein GX927_08750 [Lentisphaerae bacterium]|jgi:hypothetical protein|nr:hypothetical protein [Lentisphaerota bacterium]